MATHLNVQLKTVRNLKATATFFNFLSFKKKKRKERRKESTIFLSAFHELFVHIVHNLLQN